jgi:hypothetical protein
MIDFRNQRMMKILISGKIYGYNVVVTCLPAGVYGTTAEATVVSQRRLTFPDISFSLTVLGIGRGARMTISDWGMWWSANLLRSPVE